jgi:hypothetical protein
MGTFHAPTELADHVISYADSLSHHAEAYGKVPESSPADLKPLVADANKLKPLAQQISDLELKVATLRAQYDRQAASLWTRFTEKLAYARVYAAKSKNTALSSFLSTFSHHAAAHKAAQKAGVVPASAKA